MKTRFALLFLVMLLLVPTIAQAQFAKVGTSGAQFLKIDSWARTTGMADACIAVVDDATACFWNPAAIARVQQRSLALGTVDYIDDIRQTSVAYVQNFGGLGHWGGFLCLLTMGDMPVTTPEMPTGTGRTFTFQALAGGLSFAKMLTDKFSLGLDLKLVREDYDLHAAQTWSADVGTFYNTGWKSLRLGMSFQNFGPELKPSGSFFDWENGEQADTASDYTSYSMPMVFRIGLAMDPINTSLQKLTLAVDGVHPNDNVECLNLGAEYTLRDLVVLRAGYKLNYDEEGFAAGAGFRMPVGPTRLSLDYAFADFGQLPDVHRVSTGLVF
jgi:long-subunit fatty acid transport protein